MVISFTGKKTGRPFSIPVSYCRENGTVYCFTHAQWWRNLAGGGRIRLLIRRKEYPGTAISIREDRDKKISGLEKLLTSVPKDAVFYGVKMNQDGTLNQNDLAQAADGATMIKVNLDAPMQG